MPLAFKLLSHHSMFDSANWNLPSLGCFTELEGLLASGIDIKEVFK